MLKRVKKKSKLLRCFLSWLPEEVLLPNNICAFPERKAREEEARKARGSQQNVIRVLPSDLQLSLPSQKSVRA